MLNHLVKTISGVKGEIISQDETKTVIRLPVTRFGSPDKKDLHQEFFTSKCYFGDDVVTQKFALYEHLLNPTANPHAPEGVKAQVLGKATLAKTDDMARWFDFEIGRANQYHDYVLKLNEMGYLGTSTQCFPGGKTKNAETGEITDWLEGEVTLTPTPADHLSVPIIRELAKSFGLPEPVVAEEVSDSPSEPKVDAAPAAAAETPAVPETPAAPEANGEEDAEAQMNAILNQDAAVTDEQKAVGTPAQFEALQKQLKVALEQSKAVSTELATIKAWIWGDIAIHGSPGEGESLVDVLAAIRQLVGSTDAQAKALKKAQLNFADFVVKKLTGAVNDAARKSAAEREADALFEDAEGDKKQNTQKRFVSSNIPEHAPGG